LGVYLRQGTSGLGTVTFYDPKTGCFGALGHGVNGTSGQPLQMREGSLFDATVLSVCKGQPGKPGQIMGQLLSENPLGTLEKNVTQGIFGKAAFAPDEPLPVGDSSQVHTGSATIRSTVDSRGVQEYSVEIVKIYPNGSERSRNLLLRVTDQRLLATTGGIVQGMSGSPIIQDGKLIGAVTHVLVNDPTTGYGIFIENMLDAAA
jgi:stage IV sporulation protein B